MPFRDLQYETLPVGNNRVRYLRLTQGKPILLFLHGFAFPPHYYSRFLSLLAREFDIVAPSMFGVHYLKHQPCTIEQCCRETLLFLRELKLGPCHLAGHSTGGAIAIQLARKTPESLSVSGLNTVQPVSHRQAGLILRGLAKHAKEMVGAEGRPGARFALPTFAPYMLNLLRKPTATWSLIGSIADFRYEGPPLMCPVTLYHSKRDEYFRKIQPNLIDVLPNLKINDLQNRNHDWPILYPVEAALALTRNIKS